MSTLDVVVASASVATPTRTVGGFAIPGRTASVGHRGSIPGDSLFVWPALSGRTPPNCEGRRERGRRGGKAITKPGVSRNA